MSDAEATHRILVQLATAVDALTRAVSELDEEATVEPDLTIAREYVAQARVALEIW
jgi:hypothetical protein